jgi:hypothetical protein
VVRFGSIEEWTAPMGARGRKPRVFCPTSDLGTRVESELLEDLGDVVACGALGDRKPFGDLAVSQFPGYKVAYRSLTGVRVTSDRLSGATDPSMRPAGDTSVSEKAF